jgi:phospholipase/carboxylesterase
MDWTRFSRGHRLDPIAGGPPDAVVVLLHDMGQSTATLRAVVARWAAAVPTTAFVAFDGIELRDPPPRDDEPPGKPDPDPEPRVLDRIARDLAPLIAEEQRFWEIGARRLVLVGFHRGGTVALHLALDHGCSCAGVLAFSPGLSPAACPSIRTDAKIRLIESCETNDVDHAGLRDAVASLAAHGIDARGAVLNGPAQSDEAIRYGGAYLVELIATAQRRRRRGALME